VERETTIETVIQAHYDLRGVDLRSTSDFQTDIH